ncbi:hook-length control protein FliK [Halopseudomonas sabulinigri]|uniref:Hook-length control protein FliK n=1 Tax=Halopseudomonas sabulinigri TaxID=472181 RepID=A0A1H1PNG3_9GAMM|nr:flagellar hook-length control protein FliK [Halopseudomonas sabulinigri]SDS12289.1 hook-length control protein FliK [Halopseudomonas sabulinigri]
MSSDFRLPPSTVIPPSAPTTPAAAVAARGAEAISMALQLLRPIDAALLPEGEKISAEVIQSSPRANGSGQFEVLLRLARGTATSAPATLPASSPQPLTTGTQLVVQALTQTQLMAVLQPASSAPASEPLTRLDPAQFPPGSALQARVLSQQPVTDNAGQQVAFAVLAKIVQGAATGSLLQLTSSQPVEPGTRLNANVGAQGELRVLASSAQQRQLDLLQGLRSTLQSQASSEPLFNRLDQLQASPRDLPAIPALQRAIAQVLQQVTTAQQLTTADGVANAIKQSGLFLEPNLAKIAESLVAQSAAKQAANSTAPAGAVDAASQPAGTLQRALPALDKLLPLLASLSTPGAPEPLAGVDLKGTLVNLLITLQQQLPPGSLNALNLPPGPWQQASQAAAQQQLKPGMFPLPTRALQALGENNDLGSLLRLTAALLSRIQHHQFQSLGQTQSFADGSTQTTWQLEIPMRDGHQFNHVQLRIERETPPPSAKQAEPTPQWEVRLSFNLDELGNLQAIARLRKDKVSSEFWAEQAATLKLVNNELTQLRDRLLAKGLDVGELSCHRGTPPPPRQALQQTWIDEVT